MAGMTSLTGGGGLQGGASGPTASDGRSGTTFGSDFTVNFGGARTSWVPWVALAAVAGLYLWTRRGK